MKQFSFKFLIAILALSLVGLPFLIDQADARGGGGGGGFHGGGGGGFQILLIFKNNQDSPRFALTYESWNSR